MRKFFIITNHLKDPSLSQTARIRDWLDRHGCACAVRDSAEEDLSAAGNRNYRYTNPDMVPEGTECVLVSGGDGTLLQAARDLVDLQIPLVGINMGKLGYLAEIEMPGIFDALERLLNDDYSVENRMMLSGDLYRDGKVLIHDIALNDIVILRSGQMRVVEFQIFVDNTLLCSYQADGIIISTPTGSTGYSLSAGGPIVSPAASLMLLTAVAPHTISSRPVILPDDVGITVELSRRNIAQSNTAEVYFDGDTRLAMLPGDCVKVCRSGKSTKLARVYNTSFVEILRRKMN